MNSDLIIKRTAACYWSFEENSYAVQARTLFLSFLLLFLCFDSMLLRSAEAADSNYAATTESAAEKAQAKDITQAQFKQALPGYRFSFPADHYSHDDYKTEWWYYTGHLNAKDKQKFGFELTFFRSGIKNEQAVKSGPWAVNNIYMTHFALTDINGKNFFHSEKLCRPGVGKAGASRYSDKAFKAWTENWSLEAENGKHHLLAREGEYKIDLVLDEGKAPVIHGLNGVSQKASCKGCASHYYSFTRMPLKGEITLPGKQLQVEGNAWMDHEFGSNQMTKEQKGWDWFSIQLNDQSELMLYVMRLKNGKLDENSSGTIVFPDGKYAHLKLSDYKIEASGKWQSPHTKAAYPTKWQIEIPSKNLVLLIEPEIQDQELASERPGGISYWEGSCKVSGKKNGKEISGQAYVELTGYDRELNLQI